MMMVKQAMLSAYWLRRLAICCLALPIMTAGRPAHATYTVTFANDGNGNVTETGTGTLATRTLTAVGGPPYLGASVNPSGPILFVGPTSQAQGADYFYVSGPSAIGTGTTTTIATSGSGDPVGLYYGSGNFFLVVPSKYVSGSALSSSATFANASLSTLGLTAGTYTYGISANKPDPDVLNLPTDLFIVEVVGDAPAAVPEPSSLFLVASALVAACGVAFHSRRSCQDVL